MGSPFRGPQTKDVVIPHGEASPDLLCTYLVAKPELNWGEAVSRRNTHAFPCRNADVSDDRVLAQTLQRELHAP